MERVGDLVGVYANHTRRDAVERPVELGQRNIAELLREDLLQPRIEEASTSRGCGRRRSPRGGSGTRGTTTRLLLRAESGNSAGRPGARRRRARTRAGRRGLPSRSSSSKRVVRRMSDCDRFVANGCTVSSSRHDWSSIPQRESTSSENSRCRSTGKSPSRSARRRPAPRGRRRAVRAPPSAGRRRPRRLRSTCPARGRRGGRRTDRRTA